MQYNYLFILWCVCVSVSTFMIMFYELLHCRIVVLQARYIMKNDTVNIVSVLFVFSDRNYINVCISAVCSNRS